MPRSIVASGAMKYPSAVSSTRSLATAHTYPVQLTVSSTAATSSRPAIRGSARAAVSTLHRPRAVTTIAITTVAQRMRHPISSKGSNCSSSFQKTVSSPQRV